MSPEDAPVNSNINRDGTEAPTSADHARLSAKPATFCRRPLPDEFEGEVEIGLPNGTACLGERADDLF